MNLDTRPRCTICGGYDRREHARYGHPFSQPPDTQSGERPTVEEARRALIEHFTSNPDEEYDGPCEAIDTYTDAIRAESSAALQEARSMMDRMFDAYTSAIARAETAEAEVARLRAALDEVRRLSYEYVSGTPIHASHRVFGDIVQIADAAEAEGAGLREQVAAQDRELAALSSDKQTLMSAVTHWREQVEGLRAAAQKAIDSVTMSYGTTGRPSTAEALAWLRQALLDSASEERKTARIPDGLMEFRMGAASRPVPPEPFCAALVRNDEGYVEECGLRRDARYHQPGDSHYHVFIERPVPAQPRDDCSVIGVHEIVHNGGGAWTCHFCGVVFVAASGDGAFPATVMCECGCPLGVHGGFMLAGVIEPACYGSQAGLVCTGDIYHKFTPAPPDAGGGRNA